MLIIRDIIIVLLWVLTAAFITYFFPTGRSLIWIPVILMLLILIYSYQKLKSGIQKVIIPPVVTILAFNFVANTVYMPSSIKYHGPIQASYLYNKIAQDNSVLYTYEYPHYETYFYPKNVSIRISGEQLDNILDHESCWFITSEKGYNAIKAHDEEIITCQYIFPYKKLTNISIRFLNPRTREGELKNIFLLKIR